jgi:DNA modification methylase
MGIDENSPFIVRNTTASEFLAELLDGCLDAIVTGPPYNLAGYSSGNIEPGWRAPLNNDIAKWDLAPFDQSDYLEEFRGSATGVPSSSEMEGEDTSGRAKTRCRSWWPQR